MTVKQLMQRLKDMDQNASVIVRVSDLTLSSDPVIGTVIDPEEITQSDKDSVILNVYSK